MKVFQAPTQFQPVTITLESIDEVRLVRTMLGGVTRNIAQQFNGVNGYELFSKLDDIAVAAGYGSDRAIHAAELR